MLRCGGNILSQLSSSPVTSSVLPRPAAFYTSAFGKLAKFDPSQFIPKNVIAPCYNAHLQHKMGRMYDRKPFKMELKKGKRYVWCLCGWSKHQPFCDGTHRNPQLKIGLKPLFFEVAEDGEYWLCNCKQTKHRPFCDGSHRHEDVQDKLKFM